MNVRRFLFLLFVSPCYVIAAQDLTDKEEKQMQNLLHREKAYKKVHEFFCPEQNYEFEAELLYVSSSLSTNFSDEFLLLNSLVPCIQIQNRTIQSINPEYNFGYSLCFRFQLPANHNDLNVKYAYIHNDGTGRLNRDITTETFGVVQRNIQDDRGNQHAHLHIFDFLVGRYIPLYEHMTLKILGGLTVNDFHYFFSFHNRDILMTTPEGQATTTYIANIHSQRKFRFWGLGSKIGGHFGYNFFPYQWRHDFYLYSSFEFSVLFSKKWGSGRYGGGVRNTASLATSPALPIDWQEKQQTRIVSHMHLDFSARYRYCFPNEVSISLVLGYRSLAYWDLEELNRIVNFNLETFASVPPRAETETDTLIFSGPYAAISVAF